TSHSARGAHTAGDRNTRGRRRLSVRRVEAVRTALARPSLLRRPRRDSGTATAARLGPPGYPGDRPEKRGGVWQLRANGPRGATDTTRRFRETHRYDASRQGDHPVLHLTERGLERQFGARTLGPRLQTSQGSPRGFSSVAGGRTAHPVNSMRLSLAVDASRVTPAVPNQGSIRRRRRTAENARIPDWTPAR